MKIRTYSGSRYFFSTMADKDESVKLHWDTKELSDTLSYKKAVHTLAIKKERN